MKKFAAILLCGSALIPAHAGAQSADGAVQAKTTNQSNASSVLAEIDITEIIVTARRREERLQDVPIAVQAFNEESLEARNIVRPSDLVNIAPSLKVASTASGTGSPSYELRGISSLESLATQDAPVAVYVNDVYLPRPTGTNQTLFDMENVQVLMGPQGTLFGRNATAGAILFTTHKPVDRFEAEIHAMAGNYGQRNIGGMLNIPVSDTLAVRLAGERTVQDGYMVDINTGRDYSDQDNYSLRGSVSWQPTDAIENITVLDYYHAEDNGTGTVLVAARATSPASRLYPTFQALLAQQQARGIRDVGYDQNVFSRAETFGVSNVTTIDVNDSMLIKNIIGYRHMRSPVANDLDATILPILQVEQSEGSDSYSEELQLQGKAFDNLDYILGAFAFREEASYNSRSISLQGFNPGNPSVADTDAVNKSYSLFAQGTYDFDFLEGLSATAGIRYTWDKRQVEYRPMLGTPARCAFTHVQAGAPCLVSNKVNYDEPTWTLGLDYKIDADRLVYIASRRGYRSGGFNPRATSLLQATPFAPETVTDVEVGFKGDWRLGDARLRTNIAGYHMNYDQIQRGVATFIQNVITTTVVNAAKARVKGFEANAAFEPVEGIELTGYWGLVDAVHTEFNAVVNGVPTTLHDIPFGTAKNSYGAALTLTPLNDPNIGKVAFTAAYSYQDGFYGPQQLPFFDQESLIPSRRLVNLNVGWTNINGSNLSASAFVKNVFNEKYVLGLLSQQSGLGLTNFIYGEPRFYGLKLSYKFD